MPGFALDGGEGVLQRFQQTVEGRTLEDGAVVRVRDEVSVYPGKLTPALGEIRGPRSHRLTGSAAFSLPSNLLLEGQSRWGRAMDYPGEELLKRASQSRIRRSSFPGCVEKVDDRLVQ